MREDIVRLDLNFNRGRWDSAESVYEMLYWLKSTHRDVYTAFIPTLHCFLIANCERLLHLLPQKASRLGLVYAKAWQIGVISKEELYHQNYYVEGAAFFFDYAKDEADLQEIKRTIANIPELADLSFEDAKRQLKSAAYLADKAMMFPLLKGGVWRWPASYDHLLDADLLRQFIPSSQLFGLIDT